MSMACAAPFSGLSRPPNTAPAPAERDQAIEAVGTSGGRMASTRTARRQAWAWEADTVATAGGPPSWLTRRRAAVTARSGGRWSVCTTGAPSPAASATAGASKAWLCTTSYRVCRTVAYTPAKAASARLGSGAGLDAR